MLTLTPVLASRIMNRRTTLSAPAADLDLLEREAKRRGVSLTTVLAEAVTDKAESIRRGRPTPRFGLWTSTDGVDAAQLATEPIARPPA